MSVVVRLTMYSRWIGSGPSASEKWTAIREGNRYRWLREPDDQGGEFSESALDALMTAIDRPAVERLDPAHFKRYSHLILRHYDSGWTSDYPSWKLNVLFDDSRFVQLSSESQHAWCLPIKINDPARDDIIETFDPAVSNAIASLLPETFVNRDLISGQSGMLSYLEHEPDEPVHVADPNSSVDEDDSARSPKSFEEMEQELFDVLWGIETPEEKAEAERTGDISSRLLKRISHSDIQDLIRRGANVNIADDLGQTALMHTAYPPFDRESFRALVSAGANVDARRNDGLTGLMIACAGGESKAAVEWIRAGADVHAVGPEGCTPIMLGSRWPRITEALIAAGCDVNAVDDDGHSALAYAILQQCPVAPENEWESLTILLCAGGNPNRQDKMGLSPIDHAARQVRKASLEHEVMVAIHRASPPDRDDWPSSEPIAHAKRLHSILAETK